MDYLKTSFNLLKPHFHFLPLCSPLFALFIHSLHLLNIYTSLSPSLFLVSLFYRAEFWKSELCTEELENRPVWLFFFFFLQGCWMKLLSIWIFIGFTDRMCPRRDMRTVHLFTHKSTSLCAWLLNHRRFDLLYTPMYPSPFLFLSPFLILSFCLLHWVINYLRIWPQLHWRQTEFNLPLLMNK